MAATQSTPRDAAAPLLDATRLTIPELAARLRVSPAWAWRAVLYGVSGMKIPSIKLGGKRFVFVADVEKLLALNRAAGLKEAAHV